MYLKQLSVFVENKQGRLVAITDALAEENINIFALSVADTSEYGILRLIVSDSEKAVNVLKKIGVFVRITDVVATVISDVPGALSAILHKITDKGIEVEYMYAFLGKIHGKAIMVFKLSEPDIALEVFQKEGIQLVDNLEYKE